jgi:hypothetical protein
MPNRLTIWMQALILALGACPLPAGLLAVALTSAAGCQLGENTPIPCVVLGHDIGGLLYEMANSIRFVALTIPLAVSALIVWRIVLYFTSRHTEPAAGRRQMTNKDGLPKFPGPLTIGPPLKGHLIWLFVAACLTVLSVDHDTTAILMTAFFGVVTMLIVVKLLPGSRTLRLDASGFETTLWFRTRRFRWSEVSSFAVWGSDRWGRVTFKDKTRRPGFFDKMSTALMGARNNVLPNSYAAPLELAHLMNTWRNSALNATKRADAEATAGPVEAALSQQTPERSRTSVRAPLRQLRARRRLLLD